MEQTNDQTKKIGDRRTGQTDKSLRIVCPVVRGVFDQVIKVKDVDEVVHQYEKYWGVGRLPRLVNEWWQFRFQQQMELWDDAIQSNDPQRIDEVGNAVIRAYQKLDEIAKEKCEKPLTDTIWTAKHKKSGKIVGIYNGDVDITELHEVCDVGFSIEEAVQFFPALLVAAVETFPDSKITNVELNDEIPF